MINPTASTRVYQPASPKKPSPNVCPVCGGLECVCRPRFFAGQLLTDDDLNRLDRYIRGKNKLHNRYLHGTGVVCGLDVLCHPCDGYVTVKAGYAISPCGEDVVVCKDDVVNVCELIQRCRERDRQAYDCEPVRPYPSGGDCNDMDEEWLLAICYDERPTRGVMALRHGAGPASCARCNCGGSSGCSCGCHEQAPGRAGTGARKAAKAAPAQCEPTVTCETYRFELRRVPPKTRADRLGSGYGKLSRRVLPCLQELLNLFPTAPEQDQPPEVWQRWCCDVKMAFQDALDRYGIHDCRLDDRLAAFRCPDPGGSADDEAYRQDVMAAVQRLAVLMAEQLRSCMCSAFLPPCPPAVDDDCVPLASIHVRRSDCRIVRVCSTEFRQMAITLPALQYWLSLLLPSGSLGRYLTGLCCPPLTTEGVRAQRFQPAPRSEAEAGAPAAETFAARSEAQAPGFTTRNKEFAALVSQAWAGKNRTLNAYTLVLDGLGAVDEKGRPLVSDIERENPLEAVLLNQLILPLIDEFASGQAAKTARPAPPPADDLKSEIAQLREMVRIQQQAIDGLQKSASGGKPEGREA